MFVDARTLPAEELIETEVCIIGAGPAGITLAREFAGQDFRVCLLESGGLEFDEHSQELSEGETIGPYLLLSDTRCRQFGGTANLWDALKPGGVRYTPLDEIDFEKRDWLPYSGWPFSKSHLDPFYERAQSVCKIGPFAYNADAWEEPQTPRLPFAGNRVTTTIFQLGLNAVFTQEYCEEINRADNITTYLYANVVEIETSETARTATRLRVACLQGNEFWVAARVFVLAAGGIENARLLLLSNKTQKAGLGNQNDLVGRFFMEHPAFLCGLLIPANRQIFNSAALYDTHLVNDVPVAGKLVLTEEVRRREKLLNSCTWLTPKPKGFRQNVMSPKALLASSCRVQVPEEILEHLNTLITGSDEVLATSYRIDDILVAAYGQFCDSFDLPWNGGPGWSQVKNKHQRFASFEIAYTVEQAPDPDNRVTLSAEHDELGLRKVQLSWRWRNDPAIIYSLKRTIEIFAEEIAGSELGQLKVEPNIEAAPLFETGAHHHMGATRMHTDPKQGVVDENCQVHNVSNLFIAGSSVFPTGGYANPTLTIVALAVRLADHVKNLMAA